MITIDAKGLPPVGQHVAVHPHEGGLIREHLDFMLSSESPERVIVDKTYDCGALDGNLAQHGMEMIAADGANRLVSQHGRSLRRYNRRWTVERAIASLPTIYAFASVGTNSTLLAKVFFVFLALIAS
jgi:hypothetical protein